MITETFLFFRNNTLVVDKHQIAWVEFQDKRATLTLKCGGYFLLSEEDSKRLYGHLVVNIHKI